MDGIIIMPDGSINYEDVAKSQLGEHATKEKIDEKIKELKAQYEADQQKLKEKQQRDAILEAGTLTSDGEFWFNEEWAKVFMTKVATAKSVGFTYIKWKNAKREVVEVPLDKADEYMKEMITTLDKVYLGE
jgi:hypothetical protein